MKIITNSLLTLSLSLIACVALSSPETWNVTATNNKAQVKFTIYTKLYISYISKWEPSQTFFLTVNPKETFTVQNLGYRKLPEWRQDITRCVDKIIVEAPTYKTITFTPENSSKNPCSNWNFKTKVVFGATFVELVP